MSLREDLARRLWLVVTKPDSASVQWDASPNGSLAEYEKAPWFIAADECIRQMEWARGIGYRHAELAAQDADYVLKVNSPPLTIAPPDWTP
jgi:hypothetical protein